MRMRAEILITAVLISGTSDIVELWPGVNRMVGVELRAILPTIIRNVVIRKSLFTVRKCTQSNPDESKDNSTDIMRKELGSLQVTNPYQYREEGR